MVCFEGGGGGATLPRARDRGQRPFVARVIWRSRATFHLPRYHLPKLKFGHLVRGPDGEERLVSREMFHISIYRSSRADDCRSAETGFCPTSSRSFDRVLGTGVLLPVPDPRVPDALDPPCTGVDLPYRSPPGAGNGACSIYQIPERGLRQQNEDVYRLPAYRRPDGKE